MKSEIALTNLIRVTYPKDKTETCHIGRKYSCVQVCLIVFIIMSIMSVYTISSSFLEFVLDEHSIHEASKPVAVANANIKSRSRIAKGLVQNTSAQESLELNLREMLLDLEERICVGGLGNLKVSQSF